MQEEEKTCLPRKETWINTDKIHLQWAYQILYPSHVPSMAVIMIIN